MIIVETTPAETSDDTSDDDGSIVNKCKMKMHIAVV